MMMPEAHRGYPNYSGKVLLILSFILGKARHHQKTGRGCMDMALETRSTTSGWATVNSLENTGERASLMPHFMRTESESKQYVFTWSKYLN